jgi:hypothetical protein
MVIYASQNKTMTNQQTTAFGLTVEQALVMALEQRLQFHHQQEVCSHPRDETFKKEGGSMMRASHKARYSLCPTMIEDRQERRRPKSSSPPPQDNQLTDDWGYYVDTSG